VWECLSGLASPLLIIPIHDCTLYGSYYYYTASRVGSVYRLRDFSQPHKTKEQLVSPPIHLLISIFYGNFLF
jgi:hypothetical protein